MAVLRLGLGFDLRILSAPAYRTRLKSLDVLIFPELVDTGYRALASGARPHHMGDDVTATLARASGRLTVIGGSLFMEDEEGRRTNTSLVFSGGRAIFRYDKIHLFKPTHDDRYFSPGNIVETFPVRTSAFSLRAGIIVCYDLRFPELARELSRQGMDVLFVPARWPKVRDDAWKTLLRARAIENQIFVVGCNARGSEGGQSYVVDPLGALSFSSRASRCAQLCTVGLDVGRLTAARRLHNNLHDAVLLKRK